MKTIQETGYIAVRESSDGYEYFDIRTLSGAMGNCIQLGKDTDNKIPNWTRDNKIVRIAHVNITEIQ